MQIQNCTVVFKLNAAPFTTQQFLGMARNGWNTEYRPQRFHAIIMRMRRNQPGHDHHHRRTVAALIFQTGRVVLTGVQHPAQGRAEAERIKSRLQKALLSSGISTIPLLGVHSLRVVNLVGAHTMPHRLAIERFVMMNQHPHHLHEQFYHIRYDPTIFPALRCKLSICCRPNAQEEVVNASCLIYISGKIIVTGLRTICHVEYALQHLKFIFSQFSRD